MKVRLNPELGTQCKKNYPPKANLRFISTNQNPELLNPNPKMHELVANKSKFKTHSHV